MPTNDLEEVLVSKLRWETVTELPTPKEIILEGELTESMIRELSRIKHEPNWMLRLRLRAFELWNRLPMPNWLIGIDELELSNLAHYTKPAIERERRSIRICRKHCLIFTFR